MNATISAASLYETLGLPDAPLVIDVRSEDQCTARARIIPGTIRRDAQRVRDWIGALPRAAPLVLYAAARDPGGDRVAQELADLGYPARRLEGDLEAWLASGFPTVAIRSELKSPGGSRWITRERPKIDRLACPWLIRRFIDAEAQFFYTASHRVRSDARDLEAEPYDIADVTFSHRGPRCSFDAFLDEFALHDPVLDDVADIVRAADTGKLEQSREAPGLLAISLGLSTNIAEDLLLLEQAMTLYDALYAWRKKASHETHSWPQPGSR